MQIQSSYRSLLCPWEVSVLGQYSLQADWIAEHKTACAI